MNSFLCWNWVICKVLCHCKLIHWFLAQSPRLHSSIDEGVVYRWACKKKTRELHQIHRYSHRGRTYVESDRMTSYAPVESADQTARGGGRASTAMVVLARHPTRAVWSAESMGADDVILLLSMYVLPLWVQLIHSVFPRLPFCGLIYVYSFIYICTTHLSMFWLW